MEAIKELRSRTHLGMSECINALKEANGNVEKAIEFLQKKGLKNVDTLINPTEGMVFANVSKYSGNIIEVNCETDFGAKSDVFVNFVKNYFNFNTSSFEMVSRQLGERVLVRRSNMIDYDNDKNSIFTAYNHSGKIAVLLETKRQDNSNDNQNLECLDNIAMQIAATRPLAISVDSFDNEIVVKKRSLFEDEVSSKPEAIRNKIVDGKMNKWFSEVVLLEQKVIFLEENLTIKKYLERETNNALKLNKMIRYERGEKI